MGGTGEDPTTCKLGTFFQIPLTLTMPISNNFQLNGASGETPKGHGQYTIQIPHPAAVLIPLYLEGCFLVSKWVHMSDE